MKAIYCQDTTCFLHISPYFNSDSELEDIIDSINPRFEYLYSNMQAMKDKYGDFGIAEIVTNLFSGLPVPSFMRHHEEGLMGKLASGIFNQIKFQIRR